MNWNQLLDPSDPLLLVASFLMLSLIFATCLLPVFFRNRRRRRRFFPQRWYWLPVLFLNRLNAHVSLSSRNPSCPGAEVVGEVGGGLNFKRPKFLALLEWFRVEDNGCVQNQRRLKFESRGKRRVGMAVTRRWLTNGNTDSLSQNTGCET